MPQVGGYPGVSRAHLAVANNYSSPLLQGPPLCDELLALVEHMYTDEEADVVQHIKPLRFRKATALAAATGRPRREVEAVLRRLAHEKHVILCFGKERGERYMIMPIIPGTFEMTLMRTSADSVTPWDRRFATLFEALFSTGYFMEYVDKPTDSLRYLPIGEFIKAEPMALPSDRLEVILERYDNFAVGVCQCRLSKDLSGEGCGRMLEACTAVGDWAPAMVSRGQMREVSMQDVLEIKAQAESEGLVTFLMNEESGRFTSALCSCCGCCCGALRSITEFNAPGMIAPPHFMPHIEQKSCTVCGKCVKACPMGALHIREEGGQSRLVKSPERCIGCGLCSVACPEGAVAMREVPDYRKPPGGHASYFARYLPNIVHNVWKVYSSRRRE
jgi:NAD-dependent dihydropyrimidine dehydrogenase PreA subunit